MPLGAFVILLPVDQDYKILGYYFKDSSTDFEVTSNLFLRLNLDHSKNEINYLNLKEYALLSYLHQLKGKHARKATGLVFGLVLSLDEDADKFQTPLKNAAKSLQSFDLLSINESQFSEKLKEIYEEYIESMKDSINSVSIKNSVINRTKEMLSGGKKSRAKATELLSKIEDNEHVKISQYFEDAEEEKKKEEYDKAAKLYEKGAEIAEELYEEELAKNLRDRAKAARRIPELSKNLEMSAQKARNYLKNEDFNRSYIWYKKASEIARDLMLPEKEEEYALKSKALKDFYQVDEKYKK